VEPFAAKIVYNAPSLKFSPDGRQLLLFLNRGTAGEEGWVLKFPEEGAAGVRRIDPPITSHSGTPEIAWLPDNRRAVISLQPNASAESQLWMLDTTSGERYPLVSGTGNAFMPAISPAGDRLVFRQLNGNRDVVSLDVATGTPNVLISTDRNEEMPGWALNEPALAYVSDRNGPQEVWFRRPGVADRPIVSDRDFPGVETLLLMTPSLSPLGERVAYSRLDFNSLRLWISAIAGGTPIRATTHPGTAVESEFAGSWSPDGAWLAYFLAKDNSYDLMKVRTTGEAAPVLIKAGLHGAISLPDWSPTGEWIACGTLLISPDGKNERSLGDRRSPHYVFSKDGKLLYGVRPENGRATLFSLDVATGVEHPIGMSHTFVPASNLNPSIRLSRAPDGKSVVYSGGNVRGSLWLLEGFTARHDLLTRLGLRR
jgi:dipeptidyl aminopeptidase/acylaminoacyl peptidase